MNPTTGNDGRDEGARDRRQRSSTSRLGLASVLAPVLAVDALEVVAARPNVVERPLRNIRARVVVLLPQLRNTVSTERRKPSTEDNVPRERQRKSGTAQPAYRQGA